MKNKIVRYASIAAAKEPRSRFTHVSVAYKILMLSGLLLAGLVRPLDAVAADLSIKNYEANEFQQIAEITIELSEPATSNVLVNFSTSADTATPGEDFYGAWEVIEFLPGESKKQVPITILNDTALEGDETFNAIIWGVEGDDVNIARGMAKITIVDDDGTESPTISVNSARVAENAGFVDISLSLTVPATRVVTALFTTEGVGTATPGEDYYGVSEEIQIDVGETEKTVTVVLIDDELDEENENIVLNLHNVIGAAIGRNQASITVTDDDGDATPPQTLAFPGAAGYGAYSKGGRRGAVIYVTNLNDSGAGSLRAALTADGPRTVLFRVAGTISLDSEIRVENPYLTIAGQSAPGGGIAIRHSGVSGFTNALIHIRTHDVIIRHIRLRRGPSAEPECCGDNLLVTSSQDVIVDHTSMSWSTDEIMNVTSSNRVTLQNNLFSEALRNATHAENGELQAHAFGPLLSSSINQLTVYRNVFAHQTGRNPQLTPTEGGTFQIVNNMVHNTCYAMTFASRGPKADFNAIGNLITEGPLTCGLGRASIILKDDVSVYVENNLTPYRTEGDDEWLATAFFRQLPPADNNLRSMTRHEAPALEIIQANRLENALLPGVGATLPERDVVDTRVLNLIANRNGSYVDDPGDVGGWPELASGNLAVDSDLDGMDDSWEQLHGLDPSNSNDRNGDNDQDGYTNLEEFLNGTLPR